MYSYAVSVTWALVGVAGQGHVPAALPPGKIPSTYCTVQEAVSAPGPVWMGAENLAPLGLYLRTVKPVANRYTD